MLEIKQYYQIDQMEDLEIWKREYNVPPREITPVILQSREGRRLTAGLWSLLGPWADNL
jgi:putative SOS response-associated peptidase YedK